MRFLAFGGAGRAERARFGSWSEIPSGLLLDARGILPGRPSFGLGMPQGRPALIYRTLVGEGADAVVYSLLFEPRPEDFEHFQWNAAWMLASLLADPQASRILLEHPERATEETLASILDECTPVDLPTIEASEVLSGLMTRAALGPGSFVAVSAGVSMDEHTSMIDFAGALESLPAAMRTGRGWLVGGVEMHAEILGCALLIEGPSPVSADPGPGLAILDRLMRIAKTNATVADLLAQPWHVWGARGQGLFHNLKVLEAVEAESVHAWDVLGSVPVREGPLANEIRTAAIRSFEQSSKPLGFEPTTMLLEDAEAGRRRIDPALAARLDRGAMQRHLISRGVPPAAWPDWMEVPVDVRGSLWIKMIDAASGGWTDLATRAMADLGSGETPEAGAAARAAIEKSRANGGDPLEWKDFAARSEDLRTLLGQWARDNVQKMRGDWQTGYLVLGNDPGGAALAKSNIAAPIAARLVRSIWDAAAGPRSEQARVWLQALATSPLRDIVPLTTKLELAAAAGGRWVALERLRRAYDGESVTGEAAAKDERPYLARELEAFAQKAPERASDLVALRGVLGEELPEKAQRAVAKWIKPVKEERPAGTAWLNVVAKRLQNIRSAPPSEQPARPAKPAKPQRAERPPVPKYVPPVSRPEPVPPPVRVEPPVRSEPPKRVDPPRRESPGRVEIRVPDPKPVTPMPVRSAEPALPPRAAEPPVPAEVRPEPVAPAPPTTPLVRPDLREKLRVWIAGGNVEDDRIGDEELLKLFEQGNANEVAAARTIIEGFSAGLLYRLAGRSLLNPRLLDGAARVFGTATLDRIIRDAVHYDLLKFAKVAARRLALNHADGWAGAVDQSMLRVLRGGHNELRQALNREFRETDPTLVDELARAIEPPAQRSSEDAA